MKTKQIQMNLKYFRYYYTGKIDGLRGPLYKKAVRNFQTDYGLAVDGSFGPITKAKSIDVIKDLQQKLNEKAAAGLNVDGYIGNKTINAIKKYQNINGLKVDGVCGPTTYSYLYKKNSTTKFKYPVDYINITSYFGYRKAFGSNHYGIDLRYKNGGREPIRAGDNLKVLSKGYNSSAGNYLVCSSLYNENNKLITRYFHLDEIPAFNIGDEIKQGEVLGLMGTTGNSTGYHLHLETWIVHNSYKYNASDRNKYAVNPINHVYVYPGQEVIAKSIPNVRYI